MVQGQRLAGQFLDDVPQRLGRKDALRFAERPQRRGADAEASLDLVQRAGLLQAAQAGDDRVEEREQQQRGILVEKELAIAGAIALDADLVQAIEERQEKTAVFKAPQVAGADQGPALSGHRRLANVSAELAGKTRKKPLVYLCSCFGAKVTENGGHYEKK